MPSAIRILALALNLVALSLYQPPLAAQVDVVKRSEAGMIVDVTVV